MHLSGRDDHYMEKTLDEMKKYKTNYLVPAYCSGMVNSPLFAKYFGDCFTYGGAERVFRFR